MAEKNEKPYEKMNDRAAETITRQARDAAREAGERIIKEVTDRGFRDEDVRPYVREGVMDGADDLRKKKTP